jgi:hypothetical protein
MDKRNILSYKDLADIETLHQFYGTMIEEILPLLVASCMWENGTCLKMRMYDTTANCCNNFGYCEHLHEKGCGLGDKRPLLCKLFLCAEAEHFLKAHKPDVVEKRKAILDATTRYPGLLGKEFAYARY